MKDRIKKFREKMAEGGLDAAFIANNLERPNKNLFYLTGFSGDDGYLLLTKDKATLFVDGRYPEQAHEETREGINIETTNKVILECITQAIQDNCIGTLGIEEKHLTYAMVKSLQEKTPNVVLKPSDDIGKKLRVIKSPEEIEYIKASSKVATDALQETIQVIKEGVSENDICTELEYQMKRRGAKKPSFDSIIASGYRGAMAHGVASDKKLKSGEFLVVDWGCIYKNYASDQTRTLMIGEPTEKHKEIYNLVRRAHEEAMGMFRPGVKGFDADKKARDIITDGGYTNNFNHSLGHGLGLEVHEAPVASFRGEDVFESGMVCTDEPGIYIEGWGGVRIEDTIHITKDGGVSLTHFTKDMIIV